MEFEAVYCKEVAQTRVAVWHWPAAKLAAEARRRVGLSVGSARKAGVRHV